MGHVELEMARRCLVSVALLVALVLASPANAAAPPEDDPLEGFNRAMFSFNKALVEYIIEPQAAFWSRRLPDRVETGLGNMYSNLTEIEFLLNGLLTADAGAAATSATRFVVNSTLGLGGWFDVAKHVGLERRETEFGASLCATGLPAGPYLVLPFVGSTNVISAGTLSAGIAIEVYLLSFISTMLAALDFFVIDLGGSAAALRYTTKVPPGSSADAYNVQRAEYLAYIREACSSQKAENSGS